MPIPEMEGYLENPQYEPMNPLEKSVVLYSDKKQLNFAEKIAERSNHSFSVYLMNHLFEPTVLFNMSCIELN